MNKNKILLTLITISCINPAGKIFAADFKRSPATTLTTTLKEAATEGRIGLFSLLLTKGADYKSYDSKGTNLLCYLIAQRNTVCIKKLLDYTTKNDPEYINKKIEAGGLTALMLACQYGFEDIYKELLSRGADYKQLVEVNNPAFPNLKLNALASAIQDGQLECVTFLLNYARKKGDFTYINSMYGVPQTSATMLACQLGRENILKELLEQGADYRYRDHAGENMNVLHHAILFNQPGCAKVLLDYAAEKKDYDFTNSSFSGCITSMIYATKEAFRIMDSKIVVLFLNPRYCMDVNKSIDGVTALTMALREMAKWKVRKPGYNYDAPYRFILSRSDLNAQLKDPETIKLIKAYATPEIMAEITQRAAEQAKKAGPAGAPSITPTAPSQTPADEKVKQSTAAMSPAQSLASPASAAAATTPTQHCDHPTSETGTICVSAAAASEDESSTAADEVVQSAAAEMPRSCVACGAPEEPETKFNQCIKCLAYCCSKECRHSKEHRENCHKICHYCKSRVPADFKHCKCGACEIAHYCCKEHQIADWKRHRPWCEEHRPEESEDSDSEKP